METKQLLAILANDYGVHFAEHIRGELDPNTLSSMAMACDANPGLITVSNAGIPAFLANYLDPRIIDILLAPMRAEEIYGSVKKGDWTTLTAQFPVGEMTGEASSYGDYSNNGQSSVNFNWVSRQSYHWQTITNWGERELAIAGEAQLDLASRNNRSSVNTITRAANKIAFFGVAGVAQYGGLNDPNLPTPLTPSGTGTAQLWANKTPDVIFADLQSIYQDLATRNVGLVERDMRMTIAMSNSSEAELTKTNQYNVNVSDQIKKNWPNARVIAAPEYATASGNLIQWFVDEVEGVETVRVAFTERMRAHPVKVGLSSFKQKKSAGSWATIWFRPTFCSSMLGV